MIKLFISQPMAGKSKEEILTNRNKAIAIAKYLLGDEEVEDHIRFQIRLLSDT